MDTTTITTVLDVETSVTVVSPDSTSLEQSFATIGYSEDISQLHEDIHTTNSLLALLIILLVCFVGVYLFYGFFRDLFAKF